MLIHRACGSALLSIALSGGLAAWAGLTPKALKALVTKNAQGIVFINVQAVDARERELGYGWGDPNDIASMINEYRRIKGRVDQKNRAIADLQKQGVNTMRNPPVYNKQGEIDALLRQRNDILQWGSGLAETIRYEFKCGGVTLGDKAFSDLPPLQEQSSQAPIPSGLPPS